MSWNWYSRMFENCSQEKYFLIYMHGKLAFIKYTNSIVSCNKTIHIIFSLFPFTFVSFSYLCFFFFGLRIQNHDCNSGKILSSR